MHANVHVLCTVHARMGLVVDADDGEREQECIVECSV